MESPLRPGAIESPSYHEMLKRMPVELEDAIGVLRQHQKLIKDTLFNPENPRAVRMHLDAMTKALNDLAQDKPVDVTEQVRDIQRPRYTESYTIDNLRQYLSDVGIPEEQISAYEGTLRANAKIAGEDFDVYVSKRIAGGVRGEEVPEGALYQKKAIIDKLSSFFDTVIKIKDNVLRKFEIGALKEFEVDAIKKATGIDLTGYKRVIDNYAINHILKEHGDSATEEARGLVAVTKEDITLIPEIVENPDRITPAGKTKVGRETILYEKKFDGFTYYLEEKRAAKKEVATVTMYKKKGVATSGAPEGAPSVTSETLRTPSTEIILPSEENLKQIHARKVKGAVSFLEDGRAVIHAFEGFDFSTLVHETAHIFRRHLPEGDLRILESEYKITDGKWTRGHEENFAKGLERYFAEGKAPTAELQGVFAQFKKWILEIYRNIIGDDVWNGFNPCFYGIPSKT